MTGIHLIKTTIKDKLLCDNILENLSEKPLQNDEKHINLGAVWNHYVHLQNIRPWNTQFS